MERVSTASLQPEMFDIYGHLPSHSYMELVESSPHFIENFGEKSLLALKIKYRRSIESGGDYKIHKSPTKKDEHFFEIKNDAGHSFCSVLVQDGAHPRLEATETPPESHLYLSNYKTDRKSFRASDVIQDLLLKRVEYAQAQFNESLESLIQRNVGFYVTEIDFTLAKLESPNSISCQSWVSRLSGGNMILNVPFALSTELGPMASGHLKAAVIDISTKKPTPLPKNLRNLFFKNAT